MRRVQGTLVSGSERHFVVNPEDPPDQQVVVTYKVPTEAQRRAGYAIAAKTSEGATSAERAAAAGMSQEWQKLMIETHVIRVAGYARLGPGGPVPIETGADLFEHGEYQIVGAVAAEILATRDVPEESKKNSNASSVSTLAAPLASIGTAASAAPAGSLG